MLAKIFILTLLYVDSIKGFSIPDDSDSEDPSICGSYRELARLPNPLSFRGSTCCENNTCFYNDKKSPWEHVSELPKCPKQILPEFLIFTPENETAYKLDYFNLKESSQNLTLNSSRPFFTIIHGWNTIWTKSWVVPMKDALIDLEFNVLIVNWTNGSNIKDYIQAVANTRSVGVAVANVLNFLNDSGFIDLSNTTIIGFSLGAHTAGYAGRNLPGLWRIIGLDPAGPLFVCEDIQARLDKTDAQFVLVIHSNGASVFDGGLGTLEQMGHVDFYPNGGLIQTGCVSGSKGVANKLIHLDFSKLSSGLSCSHTRGALIWIEVIKQYQRQPNSCFYKAFPCNDSKSWKFGKCFNCGPSGCPTPLLMADKNNTPHRGRHYFNTLLDDAETGHFCGRQYLLTLTSDVNAKGEIVIILKTPVVETNPLQFQKDWHTLKARTPRSEVFVIPWHIDNVTRISLTYKRYTNKFWYNGIKKFTLLNATLTDSDGNIKLLQNSLDIMTDEPVEFAVVA